VALTTGAQRGPRAYHAEVGLRRESTSLACALRGLAVAWRGHRHLRVEVAAAAVALAAGAVLGLSAAGWAVLVATITLVLVLETVNTAIEAAVDLASPGFHPLARKAKDTAAGAVLLAAAGSVVVGCVLFGPQLLAFAGL